MSERAAAVRESSTEPLSTAAPKAGDAAAERPQLSLVQAGGNARAVRRMQESGGGETPSVGEAVLDILKGSGPGRPLPPQLRETMEIALGAEFGRIRIHTDGQADEAADELDAEAFAIDQDIYFGAGQFKPGSGEGRDLIAHELAHTLANGGAVFDPAQVDAQPPDPLIPVAETVEEVVAEEPELEEEPEEVEVEATADDAELASEAPASESATAEPEAGGGGDGGGGGQGAEEDAPPPSEGRADVTLLMPPPPSAPSNAHRSRVAGSQAAAGEAGRATEDLPSSDESKDAARGAVTEPAAETSGRAENALAEALTVRDEPSPELVELCDSIRESIREKRPLDEDELVEAEPEAMAAEAGGELDDSVEGDTERVEGSYADLEEEQTGEPVLEPEPVEVPPETVDTPEIGADDAVVPDPLAPEQTDLGPDMEQTDQQIDDAGLNAEPAQLVEDGPIAEVRSTRGELGETAEKGPAEVMAEQEAAFQSARGDMAAIQAQALASLESSRTGAVQGVDTQQGLMVGTEQDMRDRLSNDARDIFVAARDQVKALLEPLPEVAMGMWETGIARHSQTFRDKLDRVKRWIDERHSGVGGALLGAWDSLTGLPGWVTDSYDAAEQAFGDDACELILEISTEVNRVIAAAEALIAQARTDIDALFSQDMPEELREWAEAERARIQGQLDGLAGQVAETRDGINRDLAQSAVRAVREVQDEVAALREAAKGLIGMIADAIGAFLDDPIKFIIDGLLKLVGISPTSFWSLIDKIQEAAADIADDPIGFANNLVSAIGQGFQQFFDNIFGHLLDGFLEWLFGKVEGLEVPSDFSLDSLVTFFLQMMGITWPNIRAILVEKIGEENVALIERAWELISTLVEKGPAGIVEMIGDKLDPTEILSQVMDAAVEFMIEALIKAVTPRVIALFNPAGAILQAVEIIFRVLKWVFENAAKIFSLIETVVNGIVDIIAGNISGMASAIETALAGLIAPVIDFLAGFFGMGDLPEKVQGVVENMREWVLGIIEDVIDFFIDLGKKALGALGLGGEEEAEEEAEEEEEGAGDGDTELGTSVGFSAGGERHHQWVAVSADGSSAELMVASDEPMTVGERLDDWDQRAPTFFEDVPEQADEAKKAIRGARALLDQANSSKNQIMLAFREANRIRKEDGEARLPNDDPLERKQQALSALLEQLFWLFDEDPEDVVAPIHALVGTQLVVRGTGRKKDRQVSGLSLPPDGYIMQEVRGRINIRRADSSDPATPAVHLDETGVLREGSARAEPVDDEVKIAEYQKVLEAASIPEAQWPRTEVADDYRKLMRAKVVKKFAGKLPQLDAKVLTPVIVDTQFNRVIGEIFEEWVRQNLSDVKRERPEFLPVSGNKLTQKRTADARTDGSTLVEVKAISSTRRPSGEEQEQMEDYNRIVSPPRIPWIRKISGKPVHVEFTRVRYVFNNLDVARAWKGDLVDLIPRRHETVPVVPKR